MADDVLRACYQFQKICDVLAELCESNDIKVTLKSSLRGGFITGVFAFFGGLLMGTVGLPVGGAIGGVVSSLTSPTSFKPVSTIIKEMTPAQKKALSDRVVVAFKSIQPQDLLSLLVTDESIQLRAIREVVNFLQSEMKLSIQQ